MRAAETSSIRASAHALLTTALLIYGLVLCSDGQAWAQSGPPGPPKASDQRTSAAPPSGTARENLLLQETKGIDGHAIVIPDDILKEKAFSTKDKLRKLNQERLWAVSELDQQRHELDKLFAEPRRSPVPVPVVSDAEYDVRVRDIDAKIKEYEAKQNAPGLKEAERADARVQLLDLTRQKARAAFESTTYRQYRNELSEFEKWEQRERTANSIIEKTRPYLTAIDSAIGELMLSSSDESQFRLQMGLGFLVLVTLLIVCFFIFASRSGSMREILRDDRGLQFITLFSLVIAITLFGLLNILEGKELAALLGGLSGYILGRSNLGGGHPDRRPEHPDPTGGRPAEPAPA